MNRDEQINKRCNQLFALGLIFNGESYVLKTENYYMNVHHLDITCDSDKQWDITIKELTELKEKYDTGTI